MSSNSNSLRSLFAKLSIFIVLSLLSVTSIAQPLPCPPENTTWIDGIGDTAICVGTCTDISCVKSTTIKSTTSYVFSTIPYLPTSFSGGTPILVGMDDIYSAQVAIPFDFCFYGTKYNQCVIGPNGQICFNAAAAGGGDPWTITGPLPGGAAAAGQRNCIMGAYYDIDPSIPGGGGINWAVYGTAPCRTFVVSWNNIFLYNTGTCPGQRGTQQIVLYESTYAIDIFIQDKPICMAWNSGLAALGIEDATGTNFNFAPGKNGTVWASTNEGFRFTPDGAPSWTYTWYDHSWSVVGTTQTINVCPDDSMTYTIKGVASSNCDSYIVYSHVFVDTLPNPKISYVTLNNPSRCGLNNGSIILHGLHPGMADTIYYKFNGVLQPYVAQVSALDGTLTLSDLCEGIYDSVVVKVGLCHTDPYGPYTLISPPLTLGLQEAVNPSACGLCDGHITLNNLIPGQVYTLSYTKDGAAVGPVTITATGGGTYVISGLCAATYDNIVLSLTGPCTPPAVCMTPTIGPYTLVNPPPAVLSIVSAISPTECGKCNGSILIRAAAPFTSDTVTYTFGSTVQPSFVTVTQADSSIYLPGLCAGSYYNFEVKIGACTSYVSGTAILTDPPLTASFNKTIHLACHGDSVIFTNGSTTSPTGSLYYLWNFGDGSSDSAANPVHVYPAGSYTVNLTATNHYCNSYFSDTFTLGHPLKAVFTESPEILCQGQQVMTTNTSIGAARYAWTFGNAATDTSTATDPTHTYSFAGTYNVQLVVSDNIPCYDTMRKTVYVDTISGIVLNLTDSTLCAGTNITATALFANLGNTGVTWQFGDGRIVENENPILHGYKDQGQYVISVKAHYRACQDTSISRNVTVFQQPGINIGRDTSICLGSESISLSDEGNKGNPLASWLWSTGERTRGISIVAPGKYYATVNINNCYASDTVEVLNDCYVSIPNAFTPNGDGVNDYFFPRQYLSRGLKQFSMSIYNRWGQLIFESKSLEGSGWDGKLNNVEQPSGVFMYVIDAVFRDGQKEHHQGNVTLLR